MQTRRDDATRGWQDAYRFWVKASSARPVRDITPPVPLVASGKKKPRTVEGVRGYGKLQLRRRNEKQASVYQREVSFTSLKCSPSVVFRSQTYWVRSMAPKLFWESTQDFTR